MSDTKKNQMAVSSIYLLMEGITQESCSQAMHWIIDQNLLAERSRYPKDHLTLIVNSPGGSVHACFALMDCMNMSRLPVHTVGLGLIASCGALITMNGLNHLFLITTLYNMKFQIGKNQIENACTIFTIGKLIHIYLLVHLHIALMVKKGILMCEVWTNILD